VSFGCLDLTGVVEMGFSCDKNETLKEVNTWNKKEKRKEKK